MASYADSYHTRAVPDAVTTVSYTVRRLGHAAWLQDIATYSDAQAEARRANRVCAPGHVVVAELSNGGSRVVTRHP
jgi:hypothetical protein